MHLGHQLGDALYDSLFTERSLAKRSIWPIQLSVDPDFTRRLEPGAQHSVLNQRLPQITKSRLGIRYLELERIYDQQASLKITKYISRQRRSSKDPPPRTSDSHDAVETFQQRLIPCVHQVAANHATIPSLQQQTCLIGALSPSAVLPISPCRHSHIQGPYLQSPRTAPIPDQLHSSELADQA